MAIHYSVSIYHINCADERVMGVTIEDIASMRTEQRVQIAADLRAAADLMEISPADLASIEIDHPTSSIAKYFAENIREMPETYEPSMSSSEGNIVCSDTVMMQDGSTRPIRFGHAGSSNPIVSYHQTKMCHRALWQIRESARLGLWDLVSTAMSAQSGGRS